ncbi:RadC family protein [Thermovibrio sp.]
MERIKELPKEERPREKLINLGPKNLTDGELLAILIRTGTNGKSALQIARELLKEFESLEKLSEASLRELTKFKGLGLTKAITLVAAFEIGKRARRKKPSPKITSPEEAFEVIKPLTEDLKVEELGVITLNSGGRLISVYKVARGSGNRVSVSLKEVLNPAVRDLAHGIILFHNHPSGEVNPSREDLLITEKVREGARLLGIELLDHIIVSGDKFFSFKGEGLV